MKAEIKDGRLIVTIDLHPNPVISKSGKSLVVASTNGNQQSTCLVNGKPVVIGLNAYIINR